MIRYACPFCYKTMPQGYEPSMWSCCGKTGHATVFPECPKCHAEIVDGNMACVVCGYEHERPQSGI